MAARVKATGPAGRRRVRADVALVEKGVAPSRGKARALILAGEVLAGDRPVEKAGDLIDRDAALRLRSEPAPWASRGGVKLAHALDAFAVDPRGRAALDIGASTGGFTDVLLQRGAARVFCVDVGYGQLHAKLARDPRVTALDRTNIRTMPPGALPEPVDLVVIDVSFISLRLVLPVVPALCRPGAPVVALVKPQFEVGRGKVGKGGIVRDEVARAEAVASVAAAARALGFAVLAQTPSPIAGGKGNLEFFLHLAAPAARG